MFKVHTLIHKKATLQVFIHSEKSKKIRQNRITSYFDIEFYYYLNNLNKIIVRRQGQD